MAIGMAQSNIDPEKNRSEKEQTYEVCRCFMHTFEERNGSTVCRELLGCDISTPEGLAKARQEGLFQSRCTKFICDAVEIVESMLLACSKTV
jgi:C_GCAxxG_C_C family probable redox protein